MEKLLLSVLEGIAINRFSEEERSIQSMSGCKEEEGDSSSEGEQRLSSEGEDCLGLSLGKTGG
jgi:hypothetical protein